MGFPAEFQTEPPERNFLKPPTHFSGQVEFVVLPLFCIRYVYCNSIEVLVKVCRSSYVVYTFFDPTVWPPHLDL